jgi:invasion protein IalB
MVNLRANFVIARMEESGRMISQRSRIVALAAGMAGMLTVLVGVASPAHASSYTNSLIGPFSSQSVCAAQSAAENDPPQDWTSACRFSETHPGTTVPDPGWYYNLHILIP